MNQKTKNMVVLFVLVALVGTGVFMYASYFVGDIPPVPPTEPFDTDGDGVPDAMVSFSMFQALRVVYDDGSDSWKYPQSRTDLTAMAIMDTSKFVSSLQAYLYFNLISSKQVSSVDFSCTARISLYDNQKNLLTDFTSSMPVSYTISNPQNNTDVYIISATLSATNFQDLYNNWRYSYPSGTYYYYVISCRDINAKVHFSDGNAKTFGLTGIQTTENQLWWKFTYYTSPDRPEWQFQIINTEIEWIWK